jgi:hypothetical protein
VKSLFSGIGLAALAGMLMGAAMKPQLDLDDRPAGPQVFAGWSATRSTGPFDDGPTFAAYGGEIPDYVLGTDMRRAVARDQAEPPPEEEAPMVVAAAAVIEVEPVRSENPMEASPAPEPVTYPSLAGGVAYPSSVGAPTPPAASPTTPSLG